MNNTDRLFIQIASMSRWEMQKLAMDGKSDERRVARLALRLNASVKDNEEKWITINGTHVPVSENGQIKGGPPALTQISAQNPDLPSSEKLTTAGQSGTLNSEIKGIPIRSLSNEEARKWYLEQNAKIPEMIDRTKSFEEQAKQASELRNQNRTDTRELMLDQESRRWLDEHRPNKSFEELVEQKMRNKSMSREEAIKDIYETSTKSNREVNKTLGLE